MGHMAHGAPVTHGAAPRGSHGEHHEHMVADFKRRFIVSVIVTVPIVLLTPMIQMWLGVNWRFPGDMYALFALSSFVFFYGGWPFLTGLRSELTRKRPGMMTLIGMAIGVAYLYSSLVVFGAVGNVESVFFWELATLIDIMLLGHWIEMRSVTGASRAIEGLAALLPAIAHKVGPGGEVTDVPIEQLGIGDRVLVKPGEKVPADGTVTEGLSSVNESMLTGESQPVSKAIGASAIGGSINGEGALTVEVKKTGADSYLSQMISLVRQAQQSKSEAQALADRSALALTIIAVVAGVLTLALWLALSARGWPFAIERMVTVMVTTCPHALGLAIPLVVAVSTALAAGSGLLIRNRAAFERGRDIGAVIFDKTGTLTEGRFGVTDVVSLREGVNTEDVITYAAAVEARSEHPIAKAISAHAKKLLPVEDFKSIPGVGAEGKVEGHTVVVASPAYLGARRVAGEDARIRALSARGKTVVFVLIDAVEAGAIALADVVRPESKAAVSQLKKMGLAVMMVTGDNKAVAERVAGEVGLDEYFAEVLPDKKAEKVKEVQARGVRVAMVGDGVNDAPALAQADLGIAIGAGTDVAIAAADVILVRSDPLDVVTVMGLSKATYRKMVQNLAWATGYNAIAIPLAAGVLARLGVWLTPAEGAILMSLSTVIVAINARLLKLPGKA